MTPGWSCYPEETWQARFGGSPSALGATLRLDEVLHTVVGILPAGTLPRGVWSREPAQFVIPSVAQRTVKGRYSRSEHWAMVYGRLSPATPRWDRPMPASKRFGNDSTRITPLTNGNGGCRSNHSMGASPSARGPRC